MPGRPTWSGTPLLLHRPTLSATRSRHLSDHVAIGPAAGGGRHGRGGSPARPSTRPGDRDGHGLRRGPGRLPGTPAGPRRNYAAWVTRHHLPPGTNRAVGSGYAKLTPSLRPPPRFPTKGADRARAGGATAPAPGRPRAERGQVPLGSHAAVGSVQSAVLHRANRDAAYRASPGR